MSGDAPHPAPEATRRGRAGRWALVALLAAAAVQGVWNAFHVPPLVGYDAGGHVGYLLTIVREGRLPHPTEGWSTFHPPLYYLLGAAVWGLVEPASGRVLGAAVRGIGVLAWLGLGLASYALARRRGARPAVAWGATALVLFVPVSQIAATMIGNEMLGAALAAAALLSAARLAERPEDARRAALTGALAGLALATKYTGVWVAAGALVPLLGAPFGRARARSLAAFALAAAIVAGPVYVRNLALTGSPVPMTRELEPMRSVEARSELRPRRLLDYLTLPPDCVWRPSLFVLTGRSERPVALHPGMQSVWGLAYASTWWDAFGHRVPVAEQNRTGRFAAALGLGGLVPTALALAGLLGAAAEWIRRRRRPPEAACLVMTGFALATFVAFTVRAPALAAVKGSYLLPLAAPAAVFFARGLERVGPRLRAGLLAVSGAVALGAAVLFTVGLALPTASAEPMRYAWSSYARALPGTHLDEAVHALIDRYSSAP